MRVLRGVVILLAALNAAVALLVGLVGSFADGGSTLERIVLYLHAPTAVLLLITVISRPGRGSTLSGVTLGFLGLTILGDMVIAGLISAGEIKGDWSLPLVLAAVPVIGGLYILGTQRHTEH